MMTPRLSCAMSIARADLPLAVGPHTIKIRCAMTKSVLTIIAPRDKQKLTPSMVAAVGQALAAQGGALLGEHWLSAKEACDIQFTRLPEAQADAIARDVLKDTLVDVIAQPYENRQKRLFISDMDSTIITIECIDEIADFANVKPQVAAITERAMRGEIDFPSALAERVGLLAGLPEETLQKVYDERVCFMPGAKELVATMRRHGAYTVLVSGGFDFFTTRVRDALGFHEDHSNKLEVSAGKLTGKVVPPILDRDSKLQSLMQVTMQKGLSLDDSLASGDGANDLPMIMAAGLGVAYHAKPIVQQSARARINHCDLTALLFTQGYSRDEFIS